MSESLRAEYSQRYVEIYEPLAARLLIHVRECIGNLPRVDRITARAKGLDSFMRKADKRTSDDEVKYQQPLLEIQDIVGVRVVVFYSDDVARVRERVLRYLVPIEEKRIVPDSHWKFGYSGLHLVLSLPEDVVPEGRDRTRVPEFFELQIKTLFQHAWSEANHDLGYKPEEELTPEQERRLAFAAAQAWGADREFQELFVELTSS